MFLIVASSLERRLWEKSESKRGIFFSLRESLKHPILFSHISRFFPFRPASSRGLFQFSRSLAPLRDGEEDLMVTPIAKAASLPLLLQLLRRARTNSIMSMATSSTFAAASSSASTSTPSTPSTLEALALSDPPRAAHAIRAHLSKGVAALSQNIAVSASGSRVLCSNGKTLLDMASGIGVLSTGTATRASRAPWRSRRRRSYTRSKTSSRATCPWPGSSTDF